MKLLLLPLLLLPLVTSAADRQAYTCDNGSRVELSFGTAADGRPQATLHFADGDLLLPQVPAASGALYRADDIRLHTQDDEAIFEDAKGNVRRCLKGTTPPPGANPPPAASSFLDITGSVAYRHRIALPPDAILIVRVQDVARAGAPARQLAEQRIELGGRQVPIPFATTIDRDLIGKKSRITVSARIEHKGKLLFITDKHYPVATDGQPPHIDLQMKQVAGAPRR